MNSIVATVQTQPVRSPRLTDPFLWHSYFVAPSSPSSSDLFHLFIRPSEWTKMYTFIQAGRSSGSCTVNDQWNNRVSGVSVLDGVVADVRVRYQGSHMQRTNGRDASDWDHPKPTQPDPLKALSFSLHLPDYVKYRGYSEVILNKIVRFL